MKELRQISPEPAVSRHPLRGSVGAAGFRGAGQVIPDCTQITAHICVQFAQDPVAQIFGQLRQFFLCPDKRHRTGILRGIIGGDGHSAVGARHFGADPFQTGKEPQCRVRIWHVVTLARAGFAPIQTFIGES